MEKRIRSKISDLGTEPFDPTLLAEVPGVYSKWRDFPWSNSWAEWHKDYCELKAREEQQE